jgi:hypothetical protein
MMMKAEFPDMQKTNAALRDGTVQRILDSLVEWLQPEAMYFVPTRGARSCYMFFDMTDSAQLPVIAEPLFHETHAVLHFHPAMTRDDLERGLDQLSRTHES